MDVAFNSLALDMDPIRLERLLDPEKRGRDLPFVAGFTLNPLLSIALVSVLGVVVHLEAVVAELVVVKGVRATCTEASGRGPTRVMNGLELQTRNLALTILSVYLHSRQGVLAKLIVTMPGQREPLAVIAPGGLLGEILKVLKIFLISIEIKRLPTSLNLILIGERQSWVGHSLAAG